MTPWPPKIERGYPDPRTTRAKKWGFMLNLKPGQSFMVSTDTLRRTALVYARKHGLSATSEKVNGCGYRVHRI